MQRIIPIIIMLVISSYCFAETQYKGEAFGVLGMSWSHDDESYLGNGINIGGGVGFRPNARFAFTVEADRSSFSRDFSSGVHFEGTAFSLAGNVRFYFSTDKTGLYVFGGAGLIRFEQEDSFPGDQGTETFRFEDNLGSVHFGGGVDLYMSEHISLRPEFRWTFNEISFINQLRGSVAVTYHW